MDTASQLMLVPFSLISILGSQSQTVLAQKEISLQNRYEVASVNEVFKDNILLNLAYLSKKVSSKFDISWEEINKPFVYSFNLDPNKTFAFHDDVDQKYKDTLVKTTNTHFSASDGFKADGYLFGDGVCHLASLIYWAAKEANLEAEAPTKHDFMNIPEIPKEFGVSIYNNPEAKGSNTKQNLYITNNKNKPISFKFEYDGQKVKVAILEVN